MMRERKWGGCPMGGVGAGGVGASGCPWTNSTHTNPSTDDKKTSEDIKQGQGGNLLVGEHAEHATVNLTEVEHVVSAHYGANGMITDVTTLVRVFLNANGTLRFDVNNTTMGGDPCPGVPKTLTLQWTLISRRENLTDPVISAVADVISEVSAFAQSFADGHRGGVGAGAGQAGAGGGNQTGGNHVYQQRTVVDDNDVVDQQLLEEAVRQSLESSAASAAAANATTNATASNGSASASANANASTSDAIADHEARQQQAYASHMAYTYGSAGMGGGGGVAGGYTFSPPFGYTYPTPSQSQSQSQAGKLMCRFVKDVTFPDGTQVQPGSVFLKTWRIRNDGAYPWPEQVALVCTPSPCTFPPLSYQ